MTSLGSALAGGAIASALIDTLVARNVLSVSETHGLLQRAMIAASRYSATVEGGEAMEAIADMQRRLPKDS